MGDVDWFTFTLTQQTTVIVRGSSRIDGEILDSSGNSIADFESFELPASGFVHLADLAAGKYYIEVKPASVFLDGLYSLYLLEAAEPGSTRADAVPLDFYRVAAGTISPTGDTDCFRIDVDETTHARLWAVGADVDGPDVDITGELQDSGGNTVSSAVVYETSFGTGGPLGFVLLHELIAGTHYLKVTRNTAGAGSATDPMPCCCQRTSSTPTSSSGARAFPCPTPPSRTPCTGASGISTTRASAREPTERTSTSRPRGPPPGDRA